MIRNWIRLLHLHSIEDVLRRPRPERSFHAAESAERKSAFPPLHRRLLHSRRMKPAPGTAAACSRTTRYILHRTCRRRTNALPSARTVCFHHMTFRFSKTPSPQENSAIPSAKRSMTAGIPMTVRHLRKRPVCRRKQMHILKLFQVLPHHMILQLHSVPLHLHADAAMLR